MRFAATLFVANLVSLALVTLTGLMIYWGKPNWGWVLLCAILVAATVKSKDS